MIIKRVIVITIISSYIRRLYQIWRNWDKSFQKRFTTVYINSMVNQIIRNYFDDVSIKVYCIFDTNNVLHILKWKNHFARDNSIFDSLFFGIFKGGIRCKEMPNMLTFLKNELLLYHGMSFGSISNPKLERRKDNYSFSKSTFSLHVLERRQKFFMITCYILMLPDFLFLLLPSTNQQ